MADAVEVEAHSGPLCDYFPVALLNLRLDSVVNFDLFLPSDSDNRPALYRHRDLPFTEEARSRLVENHVQRLLVHIEQQGDYHRYMEVNVRAALGDPNLTPEEKSQILYSTSCNMIQEFLTDPSTKDLLPRTQHMVGAAVEHLLSEQRSFAMFLKSASLDYRTYTHSVNVAMYTLHLAQRIGYSDHVLLEDIGVGTFLHDIGKCRVPERILNKPSKLNEAEWRLIRKHPVWGCQILAEHGVWSPVVLSITRDHHEKLDGSGYPFGVKAGDLPEYVRMTTVCDVFDALSTTRAYKKAMPSFDALEIMRNEMADQLDRKLFTQFVQLLHV